MKGHTKRTLIMFILIILLNTCMSQLTECEGNCILCSEQKTCQQCKNRYILDTKNNKCVEECPSNAYPSLEDVQEGLVCNSTKFVPFNGHLPLQTIQQYAYGTPLDVIEPQLNFTVVMKNINFDSSRKEILKITKDFSANPEAQINNSVIRLWSQDGKLQVSLSNKIVFSKLIDVNKKQNWVDTFSVRIDGEQRKIIVRGSRDLSSDSEIIGPKFKNPFTLEKGKYMLYVNYKEEEVIHMEYKKSMRQDVVKGIFNAKTFFETGLGVPGYSEDLLYWIFDKNTPREDSGLPKNLVPNKNNDLLKSSTIDWKEIKFDSDNVHKGLYLNGDLGLEFTIPNNEPVALTIQYDIQKYPFHKEIQCDLFYVLGQLGWAYGILKGMQNKKLQVDVSLEQSLKSVEFTEFFGREYTYGQIEIDFTGPFKQGQEYQYRFEQEQFPFGPNGTVIIGANSKNVACPIDIYSIRISRGMTGFYQPYDDEECLTRNTFDQKCLICKYGYTDPTNGYKCIKVQKPMEGCLSYVTEGKCFKCQDGLFLHKGRCRHECPSNTQQLKNSCVEILAHCMEFNSDDQCIKCEKDYEMSEYGSCVKVCDHSHGLQWDFKTMQYYCEKCADDKCKECSSEYICTKCMKGYVSESGKCVKECSNPEHIIHEGVCIKGCPKSRFYNIETGRCDSCPKGCSECEDRFTCLKCSQDHLFKNSCVRFCPEGTYDKSNVCLDCPDKCKHCALEGDSVRCNSCASGDYLLDNTCTSEGCSDLFPIATCRQHSDFWECGIKCPEAAYRINNTHCAICQENCDECNSGLECTKCSEGRLLHRGQCISYCPENSYAAQGRCVSCQNCDDCYPNGCFLCASGYILEDDICVKAKFGYTRDDWVLILLAIIAISLVAILGVWGYRWYQNEYIVFKRPVSQREQGAKGWRMEDFLTAIELE